MFCCTYRETNEAVGRSVDDDSEDGAIQNDADEEHQHHSNLQTGCSTYCHFLNTVWVRCFTSLMNDFCSHSTDILFHWFYLYDWKYRHVQRWMYISETSPKSGFTIKVINSGISNSEWTSQTTIYSCDIKISQDTWYLLAVVSGHFHLLLMSWISVRPESNSTLKSGNSNHSSTSSLAVDVVETHHDDNDHAAGQSSIESLIFRKVRFLWSSHRVPHGHWRHGRELWTRSLLWRMEGQHLWTSKKLAIKDIY